MDYAVSSPAAQARLTPRQRECLHHVYERRTTKEIAGLTGLAVGTVDTYVREAVTVLGARNRRHAAELLHGGEGLPNTPGKFEPEETGVANAPPKPIAPDARNELGHAASRLPFRQRGAVGNDLRPITRLVAIFGFAISFAAGFGMLAVAMRVLSDLAAKVG